MSLLDCIDSTHSKMVNLLGTSNSLFDPNLFINPQDSIIAGLTGAMMGNKQGLIDALIYTSANDPNRAKLMELYFQIYGITHGETGTPGFNSLAGQMTCYQDWTDFLSCKVSSFPSTLMPIVAGLPQGTQVAAVLGTMTFAGVLGATAGAKSVDSALCEADPNDPCAGITKVFGAILGVFNKVLTAITNGLKMMTDFLTKAGEYLAMVEEWIQQVLNFIAQAINNLLAQIMKAIRYGLSKLLSALNVDPCFSAVLGAIGTTVLLEAIPAMGLPGGSTANEFPDFPLP